MIRKMACSLVSGAALIIAGVGCGGDSDGGGGTNDDGGGPSSTACSKDAATINADGVLSAFPHISYFVQPSGFSLVSVNFVVVEDGASDGPLLQTFAEIRNNTSKTECSFIPNVHLDAYDVGGPVSSSPHYDSVVNVVTNDCIGPGGVGVMTGLTRGVTVEDLEKASSFNLDLSPSQLVDGPYPATGGPTITVASVVETSQGWALSGSLQIDQTIKNYSLSVYPRDERGVLIGELLAFPGDLGTHAAGSTVDFETSAVECSFSDYLSFQSWILDN